MVAEKLTLPIRKTTSRSVQNGQATSGNDSEGTVTTATTMNATVPPGAPGLVNVTALFAARSGSALNTPISDSWWYSGSSSIGGLSSRKCGSPESE